MKLLFTVLVIILCAGVIIAQNQESTNLENKPALILDQTTPEEAIKMFGTPTNNKIDKLKVQKIDKWLTSKRDEKIFQVLSFDKVLNLERIELSFLEDKLVVIHYVLGKRFAARDLAQIYKIEFIPVINDLVDFRPADYERLKGNVEVVNYPYVYYLVAVSKAGFISARITTDSAFADTRLDRNKINRSIKVKPLQGRVTEIQIISRKLEI